MKKKGKDPFKNIPIDLFVYNLGQIKNSFQYRMVKEKLHHKHNGDGDITEILPLTNFGEIFKAHFGEMEEAGAHKTIMRDRFKIYYYDKELETNFKLLMVVGKQAIVEILELGRKHNWAVMTPDRNGLIHLDSLSSYGYLNLEEYYGDE